ncbi:hypothetical protein GN958_ATG00222 [Phytophthora infestans]|uniref:Secreted RxLR effector peptide protein n=1 Tax=Phytophthora infestans TaxID=4787 RepID=A0A8S9VC18_PHYIN|nr:hypothetical protein GN958_ATG00222 [Phytophthora infestans]
MRFCCTVSLLLVLVSLVATSAATDSQHIASGFSTSSERSLLRTINNAAEKGEYEERAFAIPGLSKVSKVVDWIKAFILKIKLSFQEGKQLSAWLKEKKTPEDIFKLLKLDTGTKNLLASRNLRTWSVFMVLYNKENPKKMVTMLGMLTKTYGDEATAKMIEAGRKNPKTRGIGNRLQELQLNGWAQNGLSPDIVFQMLKVGEGGVDKVMANNVLSVWFYFFTRMNRYNPDRQADMMKKLSTVYDDIPLAKAFEAARNVQFSGRMGKELQLAQFKKWLAEGIEPATVFKRLNLDKAKWTTDPNAGVYREYKIFYYIKTK